MTRFEITEKIKSCMTSKSDVTKLKQVKTMLVSQPTPARSPYAGLVEKYGLKVDFRPFIHVEGIEAKEFRKQRIKLEDYTAVVFTSRNSVEHYFRMCEELRVKVSPEMKYLCSSEAIALYLQKFTTYRKRKVSFGERTLADLQPHLMKHKKEKFLLSSSDLGKPDFEAFMTEKNLNYDVAHLYRTVSSDLSDLSDITYDMLVFFSPFSINSLFENFPDFKQNETRIAAYGSSTCRAVEDAGLTLNVRAPTSETFSMTEAIENYLRQSNV